MSWFTRLFKKPKPDAERFARFDFTHTFPHVFWLSSVGREEQSLVEFRYKVLTFRHEPDMTIELILVRELLDGTKTKVAHIQGPLDKFAAIEDRVQKFGQDASVSFERFDLSALRTFDDFKARAIEIGWGFHEPEPGV
jgi:hypothetical protein